MQAYQRRQKSRLARMRAAIVRGSDAPARRGATPVHHWIAPNPGAHTRAGYFAAQGLPLPVGCGPDGRMAA